VSVPIRNYPQAFRSYLYEDGFGPVSSVGMAAVNRKIENALDADFAEALTVSTCESMTLYPELIREAGPRLLSHENARKMISSDPFLAYHLLLSSYEDLAELLEDQILEEPELIGYLLSLFDRKGFAHRLPIEEYEDRLLVQPLWAQYHINRLGTGGRLARRLHRAAEQGRETCPQCCLVYLTLHPERAISEEESTLIQTDALSSYLASDALRKRGFIPKIERIENLTPRWAAHIGGWGIFSGGYETDAWRKALCRHPGWAAEYLAIKHAQGRVKSGPGSFGEIYHEATQEQSAAKGMIMWQQVLYALLIRMTYFDGGKPCQQTIMELVKPNPTQAPSENAA